jgi:ubiquinone biosynthesis protein COQ4
MLQTRQPSAALSALVGPLRLSAAERSQLTTHYIPWAMQTHRQCTFLMAVPYESLLDQDINMVRSKLGLLAPPTL